MNSSGPRTVSPRFRRLSNPAGVLDTSVYLDLAERDAASYAEHGEDPELAEMSDHAVTVDLDVD